MKLPKLAIENHQFTIVVIILLVLAGVASFLTMPRSEDPQISRAGSNIIAVYPGANPLDLEELVLDPIETALNELEDIDKMNSNVIDGLMLIRLEFLAGSDPDDKYGEVVQKIGSIRDELPDELSSLIIDRWEVSRVNILQVALVSDSASYRDLEWHAERLKKELERAAGVKRVNTWAFPEQEIRVALNWQKMARLGIPLGQVIGAVQSAGGNIPGGSIDIGSRRFAIQTSGSYRNLEDIAHTVVHAAGGKVLYLKDIATVNRDYEDQNYYARFNQKRAVFITANQQEGTNIYDVMEGLKSRIAAYEGSLPKEIALAYVFDQSHSVSERVNGFFANLMQGVLLVGVIVLLAMSMRAALIVMMVIPTSILIGLGLVDFSQYGLEQMSIAGLVIALGLLVDNAIVVTENVSRFLAQGLSRKDAAVRGTSQIGWAVVSSTATTVLAFLPIIMMQNTSGDFIRSMPVTVVFTLSASLLVSLTLTPYLSSRFLKTNGGSRISAGQQALQSFVERYYRRQLNFSLERPKTTLAVATVVFFGALALFPVVGVSFFPKAEKPQFIINIDTPQGTSLDRTDMAARYVESVLAGKAEVKQFAANIGRSNPMIYYNIIPKRQQSTHAQFFVELHDNDLETFHTLVGDLRDTFRHYPGARIEVKEFEQGPPVEAPIAIKVLGEDLDILKQLARDVEQMIALTPGTINVNNPIASTKTDLHVNINREKAGMLGVPLAEIDRTVRAGMSGLPVATYRDNDGKDYNIVVRLPLAEDLNGRQKPRMSNFDHIYLASYSGGQVPLRQLANVEFTSSPMQISHFNLQRSVTVTADVEGGQSVDQATRGIIDQLDAYEWPEGYRYYIAGELESREESFGGMAKAVMIALIAIFGVLVLQFRSFRQPLIVFTAIPLAMIGSIIALLVTGNTFSFTAFIGLTSLVGIVVNNSIILVDYTNQLRQEGQPLLEALKEACETRFTPIILTTATTVGGLLPLTLGGGSIWAPMGWTIIGGLVVSTLLTLLVVPVLYRIFTRSEVEAA